jgi:hypothetical protein
MRFFTSPPGTQACSYIRFSKPEQLKGDSLRRTETFGFDLQYKWVPRIHGFITLGNTRLDEIRELFGRLSYLIRHPWPR